MFSINVNDENGNPILPPSDSDNGTVTLSVTYQKGLLKEQVKIAYRDENDITMFSQNIIKPPHDFSCGGLI